MMGVKKLVKVLKFMKKPLKEWVEYCRIYDMVTQNEQRTGRTDHEGRKQLRIARKMLLNASRNNPDILRKSTQRKEKPQPRASPAATEPENKKTV